MNDLKFTTAGDYMKTNERIRLLAEQATTEESDGFKYFDKEKFAQLIVVECVALCEQVATNADAMTKSKFVTDAGRMLHEGAWGGAKNCGEQIKKHFGVEE